MPTPFTHLEMAARLLEDAEVPATVRAALAAERGAFLLGNIAADARVSSGTNREDTHFYAYDRDIDEHPWQVMMARYPALAAPSDTAQRAFLAGYVAHLVVDEVWSLEVVRPFFERQAWAEGPERFLMLNLMLIEMDARDYRRLPAWERPTLLDTHPDDWLPFILADDLCDWRDFVGQQLPPEGVSQTFEVIGERVQTSPDILRELLDRPGYMDRHLWAHVPRPVIDEVETTMYAEARRNMLAYLRQTGAPDV